MTVDWYSGVCDRMLNQVAGWVAAWPTGAEYATRLKINLKLEKRTEDVVVKRLVKIPFQLDELQNLVRILEAVKPKEEMTAVFRQALKNFMLCRILQGSYRLVPVACYFIEAREVLDWLLEVRSGKSGMEARIEESRASGKSIWDT